MRNWYEGQVAGSVNPLIAGPGITGLTANSAINFFSYQGEIQWHRLCSYVDYKRLLHKASPVAAVFYKRANMFANGDVETLNRKSRKYVRGENKDWERLIERPNPFQTKTAFLKQLHLYLDIFGWCYVMPIKATGFNVPTKMFLLPPWLMTVERIKKSFLTLTDSDEIRKVYLDWDGVRTPIPEKDLILFTDTSSVIDETTLLPEGRLRNLEYPVTLELAGYEALATLLQRKGALGILSNEAKDTVGNLDLDEDEKEQLQQELRTYGLSRDQYQVIITGAPLKWQQMSMDAQKLMILEALEAAKQDICDVYGFPRELLATTKGSTFSNANEYKKSAYQDATIPESKTIMETLNWGLRTEAANIEYIISYDNVEVLQSSIEVKYKAKSAMLDALRKEWDLGTITRNMILEETGRDVVTKPEVQEEFNKYKFTIDAEIAQQQAKTLGNDGNK